MESIITPDLLAWLLIAVGAVYGGSAVLNLEWLFTRPRVQRLMEMMGRKGARLFYVILGLLCVVMGALLLLGVL